MDMSGNQLEVFPKGFFKELHVLKLLQLDYYDDPDYDDYSKNEIYRAYRTAIKVLDVVGSMMMIIKQKNRKIYNLC